ncbi:hypothetical protein Aperf_G00000053737 [Anoplocephala perfoliata]
MGRVKYDKKPDDKKICHTSLNNVVSLASKLLDSADASEKSSRSILLYLQKNASKLIQETKSLRAEKQELIREMCSAYERLEKSEETNRKLASEAQRLQRLLEAVREVLKDSDIDKAKQRLAQLEGDGRIQSPSPKRKRCSQNRHSAGSLLDSDNASSGGSGNENQNPSAPHTIAKVRRSERLNKEQLQSPAAAPPVRDLKTPEDSSCKCTTMESSEDYHDVSFRKMALDKSKLIDTDESISFVPNSTFRTPRPKKVLTNRLRRLHDFAPISSLRLGLCSCCGKRFKVGKTALRCRVCRLSVHGDCQHQLKQRCVPPVDLPPFASPRTRNDMFNSPMTPATINRLNNVVSSPLTPSTPSSTSKRQFYPWHTLSLSALCPDDESPQIPAPVIHCVNEVASRGLIQLGIYRIPGADKRVQDLLDKFLCSRTTPSLALVEDINVVCSCLKAFLRLLDEPLVTRVLRPEFVSAGELFSTNPESAKFRAAALLEKLPIANRDTLAFLILHLKDVSRSPACKMGEANLSKVFGLTIIGHSCVEPPLALASSEVHSQQAAVRLLLAVPDAVYTAILG